MTNNLLPYRPRRIKRKPLYQVMAYALVFIGGYLLDHGFTPQWWDHRNDHQIRHVEGDLQKKENKAQQVGHIISLLRNKNFAIRADCKLKGNPTLKEIIEQEKERAAIRFQLTDATTGVKRLFGDKTLEDIRALINYDSSIGNMCSIDNDKKWQDLAGTIIDDFDDSIDQDNQKLDRLD